ncbi:MAG: acetyl-CoA carboxylase biotin carboxylase subunit family protein [Betaproteobacteria bacterium]
MIPPATIGLLFDRDFDAVEHARLHAAGYRFARAGFDLFRFPSQLALPGFDLSGFAQRIARRARRGGWAGIVSHEEPFGALTAALAARAAGLPGTDPAAIVACQNKAVMRGVLARVAPEANPRWAVLDLAAAAHGKLPEGFGYPCFAKPVKAAFSVLARRLGSAQDLRALARQQWRERLVARWLAQPFDRAAARLQPQAGPTRRLLIEEPIHAPQYNLDGYLFRGEMRALGVVDAVMVPGTQAFARWQLPSRLPAPVVARAADLAQRALRAVGFEHGFFNFEFFFDAASDRLTAIEFNPRLASQFSDLYRRVQGIDPHAMAIALACGQDPAALPRVAPTAQVAASLVWRAFDVASVPPPPRRAERAALAQACPDALLLTFTKRGAALRREFAWLESHRYGIVHLGADDWDALAARCAVAADALRWPNAPYAESVVQLARGDGLAAGTRAA